MTITPGSVAFWFLKDRSLEFCSRVVDVRTRDGVPLRAKVTIHLREPTARRDAEAAAEEFSNIAVEMLEALPGDQPLDERVVTATLMARRDVKRQLRRIEVTGLHVVGNTSGTFRKR